MTDGMAAMATGGSLHPFALFSLVAKSPIILAKTLIESWKGL
jgi:hypothetical protein